MADFRKFMPGITGSQYDTTNDEFKEVQRIDKSWPEDDFGAKLSLGPNFGYLLNNMGQGDITMRTDGEAVDPPRYDDTDPNPGSSGFGDRAKKRRSRLRHEAEEAERPEDPYDAQSTDVISGKKTSLKGRRKELEDFGNF